MMLPWGQPEVIKVSIADVEAGTINGRECDLLYSTSKHA